MSPDATPQLSRRERQIMDVVYTQGRATVAEVRAQLADAPSYSAVRALLRILEEKGHLRHEQEGNRYVFVPTVPPERASKSALRHVLETFFDGSPADLADRARGRVWLADERDPRASLAWVGGDGRWRNIGELPANTTPVAPTIEDGYLVLAGAARPVEESAA